MEQKGFFARWRSNFLTGLVIVLPGVISIAALVWLFSTISNITDTLLIFIPQTITHRNNGPVGGGFADQRGRPAGAELFRQENDRMGGARVDARAVP